MRKNSYTMFSKFESHYFAVLCHLGDPFCDLLPLRFEIPLRIMWCVARPCQPSRARVMGLGALLGALLETGCSTRTNRIYLGTEWEKSKVWIAK